MPELGAEEPANHTEKKSCECCEKPEPWWDFKASHWVTAALTAALIFVGVLQYCVYSKQAAIMGSQARAWVGVSNVLIDPIKVGERMSLNVRVKNSGGTPALETTICAASDTPNASQVDIAGVKNMMRPLESRCGQKAVFFLLPNAEVGVDVSRGPDLMTKQVVDDVMFDRATFAVFGRITYKLPANPREHWTTFCALYVRATNAFNACVYGNDTDSQ